MYNFSGWINVSIVVLGCILTGTLSLATKCILTINLWWSNIKLVLQVQYSNIEGNQTSTVKGFKM